MRPPPLLLTNTWENAVWFHDARFTSLDDVVAYFDAYLGLRLDAGDRADLVTYLQTR